METSPDSDLLTEIVKVLKLDATFLQGRDELAIFNGRVYSKGEHLLIHAKAGNPVSPLVVVSVQPSRVTLRGGDKDYVLGYPEKPVLSPETAQFAGPGIGQGHGCQPGRAALFPPVLRREDAILVGRSPVTLRHNCLDDVCGREMRSQNRDATL